MRLGSRRLLIHNKYSIKHTSKCLIKNPINFQFVSNAVSIFGMITNHRKTWRGISALTCTLALSVAVTGSAIASPLAPISARAVDPAQAEAGPGPLSRGDVARYRQIFAYQDAGQWERADALIGRLRDRLLLGHVQQQRYMHPDAYRSSFAELKEPEIKPPPPKLSKSVKMEPKSEKDSRTPREKNAMRLSEMIGQNMVLCLELKCAKHDFPFGF
jgi:hypothetical protein